MKGDYAELMPFDGTPPQVDEGDPVMVRDAHGRWHRKTALSKPRYDRPNAAAMRCFLTVSVTGAFGPVNWPAEDVRPVDDGLDLIGGAS